MPRRALAAVALSLAALAGGGCSESADPLVPDLALTPDPLPVCGPMLPAGAMPSTGIEGTATSAAVQAAGVCTEVTTALTRAEAADIVPDGYVALGGAVAFSGPAAVVRGPFPHGLDVVLPADLSRGPANAPAHRVVIVEKGADGEGRVVPVSNVVVVREAGRVHFHAPHLGTFQAAIPVDAGRSIKRRFTFRAVGGVSMGGFGATVNFWSHPERYDAIGVMGADPGADFTYTLGLVGDWFFGGFCDAASGRLGQLCPPARRPDPAQHEEYMEFERLNYQRGQGVGLTLRRATFMRAYRDLSRALGNAAYGPSSLDERAVGARYLPPGVPPSVLSLSPAEFCDPARLRGAALRGFFDRRFNPDGKLPVIPFCDGGDGEARGLGVFDPAVPQRDPMHLLLAVDVDGNGQRDSGEPVIVQAAEPWDDCGSDGRCDKDEPGYDAAGNPDPAHDDYDAYGNPGGSEANWRWDAGERYDDSGLDGVKGTCQLGQSPPPGGGGCYDHGEGNGRFDTSPGALSWYRHDVHSLLTGYLDGDRRIAPIPDAMLDRLDVYYDAGIHDFFNAHVATNHIVAALATRRQHVKVWEGFPLLMGLPPSAEDKFRIEQLDVRALGRHVYVRYGDPDASPATVEATGDGRHVGTVSQAIHRGQMLFSFFSRTWPDGDVAIGNDVNAGRTINAKFTTASGRVTPYTVVTPPGYYDPQNATRGYPVVYLLHGYGMSPEDLASVVVIANAAMVDDRVPDARRMQKMIVVLVDAVCRPGGDLNDPGQAVPLAGDLCEEGAFYTDHPEGDYRGEAMLEELQARIEKDYRVRAPADIEVVQ